MTPSPLPNNPAPQPQPSARSHMCDTPEFESWMEEYFTCPECGTKWETEIDNDDRGKVWEVVDDIGGINQWLNRKT